MIRLLNWVVGFVLHVVLEQLIEHVIVAPLFA